MADESESEFINGNGAWDIDGMLDTIAKLRAENERIGKAYQLAAEKVADLCEKLAAAQKQAEEHKAEAERLRKEAERLSVRCACEAGACIPVGLRCNRCGAKGCAE
jgi:hypothetical protein